MNRKQRRAAARTRGRDAAKDSLSTTADTKFNAAVSHHQAGRLAEAQQLYAEILSREPKHAMALHLLGVIAYQQGDSGQAIDLIGKAIVLRPDYADAHSNLGNALKEQGNQDLAVAAYRKALELKPDYAEAHNNLGIALKEQGELDKAVAAYHTALELKPGYAEAYSNLGNVLKEQGKLDQAATAYHKALGQRPDYAEAHGNLGNVLKDQGKLDEAVATYRMALELKPDYAKAHNNLGNALRDQGKLDPAVVAYHKFLELNPGHAEAHNNLGSALKDQNKLDEAEAAYRRALELKPDYADAYNNLGNVLKDLGKLDEAVIAYHTALELKPSYADAHSNLGNALKYLGKLDEAVAYYRTALELNPDHADAHNNLGNTLKGQGKLEDAVGAYREALGLRPGYTNAHSNLLFCMNYDGQTSKREALAESRRWDEVHGLPRAAGKRPHPNDPDPGRRLRVGYVSPDFREHSVSYFLDPVIAGHDRRSFEVFCYAEVVRPDDTTARFRGLSDGWCSTLGMTDAAVAERIRDDAINVLVDLAGHTANNRLLVFAERPAPVQVSWLGYPNTTGLSAMDYRLSDAVADPAGDADALHSETLVRLPNGFLCFAPAADAPDVGEAPALSAGQITFGSFNNLTKVTPDVVETWAGVLHRIPKSRLVIKSKPLADEKTRERYLGMFGEHGIAAGRIELCSWIASKSGHLGAYERVDIGLDPFPYNGTTTTCEALWMGVPVITLGGDRHAGRVGASILTRVDLADLVAETKAAYVETAVALAGDLDRLSVLRSGLRSRMRRSPLCDAGGFTRDVEAAYRTMWCRLCENGGTGQNRPWRGQDSG